MKKTYAILLSILIIFVVFSTGIYIGIKYSEASFDPLCPGKPELSIMKKDLSNENIYLKKGTLVALQRCEYANRFLIRFYVDNKMAENVFDKFVPKTKEAKKQFNKMGIFMAQYGLTLADNSIFKKDK